MSSTASWALVDMDMCPNCSSMTFLWTHSLANHNYFEEKVACRGCARSRLTWFERETRGFNDEQGVIRSPYADDILALLDIVPNTSLPFFDEFEECSVCEDQLPKETTHDRYMVVDAYQADRTTIVQVHRKCTLLAECCDTRYIGGWSGGRYTEMRKLEGYDHDFCNECYLSEISKRGHNVDDYFQCPHCAYYVHYDDSTRYRGMRYCDNCVTEHVYTCDECETEYWGDDGHDCYYESDSDYDGLIHDYSYKPRPYFFGKNDKERLYFGFELEVESVQGDRQNSAEVVQNALGERAYLKNDGSLNNGFEIVTHPHSLDEYRKNFAWESFTKFRKLGLRSWDTSTCGLHVHVSRDAFGIPYDNRTNNTREHINSRQTHEIKFIKLIYDNQRQISRLAGRSSDEYANFSDRGNIVRKVKYDDARGGRHAAVNTFNESTLEVRVFKGSLIPERVLSAIEFVHAAVEYTRDLNVMSSRIKTSNGKIKSGALSWLAFCSYIYANTEQYPNLFATMVKTFDSDYPIE